MSSSAAADNAGSGARKAAGAYVWRNVVVGGGGFAPGILFSRARAGLAYLRTDMGGAYRWDDRSGRWLPLQDGESESSFMGVESIAPDPVNPDAVYMAVGMYRGQPAAILRSHDAGRSWRAAMLPISMGGNEDGRGLGERLAINPRRRDRLFFGSRHDGLWRSDDGAASWRQDMAFPYRGRGLPQGRGANGGIAFVVFDPRPASRRLCAGVADPGAQGIYCSNDDGVRWARADGGPDGLLPVKADVDATGTLYVSFSDGIGPNGVTKGAVWSLSPQGEWRDITPDKRPDAPPGGYMGISADWRKPGTLVVATLDRWRPVDTIWRSTDGGRTWRDLEPVSRRDTSATPFLAFGKPEADFGHWITGLAIDPFDSRRIAYTTGATLYLTGNGEARRGIRWAPWTRGIEQTAIITLISPTGGAPLISGFGDLGGFVHHRLDRSPPMMFLDPRHTNTNVLDYAGLAPAVVVRSGNVHADHGMEAGLGWSGDGGSRWRPLRTPDWADGRSLEAFGRAPISVSADGARFYVGSERPWMTVDRGVNWTRMEGVPGELRFVASKRDPLRVWAIDHREGRLLASRDGGAHFAPLAARGACPDLRATAPHNRESPSALAASPLRAEELFLQCAGMLYRSVDGGANFVRIDQDRPVRLFGLGRGGSASDTGVYLVSADGADAGIWRSLDSGAHWRRIDDPGHRWGGRIRVIAGDPRRAGRVYVGTDGRGIVYGDPR